MDKTATKYSIKIPTNQLKKLRNNQQFILITRLCRSLNQLSFCQQAYLDYDGDHSPTGLRQTHNALFFWFGALYEAVKINNDLGKEFMTYKSYQNGFMKFSKLPALNELKQGPLNDARNQVTYHIFSNPIETTLQNFELRRYDFITSSSGRIGDTYYELADTIALNYVIGVHPSVTEETEALMNIINKTLEVTKVFIRNANALIDEYVKRKCWKIESLD